MGHQFSMRQCQVQGVTSVWLHGRPVGVPPLLQELCQLSEGDVGRFGCSQCNILKNPSEDAQVLVCTVPHVGLVTKLYFPFRGKQSVTFLLHEAFPWMYIAFQVMIWSIGQSLISSCQQHSQAGRKMATRESNVKLPGSFIIIYLLVRLNRIHESCRYHMQFSELRLSKRDEQTWDPLFFQNP